MRNNFSKLALTAALMLAITFTFSCSGDSSGGGGSGAIKKEKISGVCEKGPFAEGSVVKIYELNAKFEKTKNSFEGKTDSKGYFEIEIKNGKLASPYIILEVSGNYINEVSGKLSTTPITLNAVADISDKSNANINVLTDLEFDRVMKQVKNGTKFEDAKKEAQKEVLNALGVSKSGSKNSEDISLFGSSPSDSVLLAVSVLLQGDRSTEEVSDLLADISSEIENNGTLSNSTKSEVANGLADVDMDKVRDNILSLDPDAKIPDLSVFLPKDPDAPSSSSSVSVVQSSSSEDISSSSEKVASSSSTKSSSSGGSSVSSSSSTQGIEQTEANVFTDPRDGKKYKFETAPDEITVWMSENLNYSRDNTLGYCYGVDIDGANSHRDSTTCNKGYGRLYEWDVAMDGNPPQGLCPNGWHVPSRAEWSKIFDGEKGKMPSNFYIYPGDYNTVPSYIDDHGMSHENPLGWRERDSTGFYWTSDGNRYWTGFWDGYNCKKDNNMCIGDAARITESPADYFSVRCIADDDLKLSCGTSSYAPATQSCCGSKVYNLETEFCSGSLIYAKCNGKIYNPAILECVDNTLSSKKGNHLITCSGFSKCNPESVVVQNSECIDLEMTWTDQYFLPSEIKIYCSGKSSSISIKVGNNPASTKDTLNSVTVIRNIKIGTTEVPDICVQYTDNQDIVKCNVSL